MKSNYFTEKEFACPCCGLSNPSDEFIAKLDLARSISKIPYIITSGSRCRKHNSAVGGHKESLHIATIKHQSEACDILADTDRKRFLILFGLISAGFVHLGINKKFIHVDMSNKKGSWLY